MKQYEEIEMEVVVFESADIITNPSDIEFPDLDVNDPDLP